MDCNSCCVGSCENVFKPGGRKFYRLPLSNQTLLNSWLNAMGNEANFEPTTQSMICSAHFTPNDYYLKDGCVRIRQSAIPSKFPKQSPNNLKKSFVEKAATKHYINKTANKKSPGQSSMDHPYAKHVTWAKSVSDSLPVIVNVQGSNVSSLENLNLNNITKSNNDDCMIIKEISRTPISVCANKPPLNHKILKKIQPKLNDTVTAPQTSTKMFVRQQTGPVVQNQMYLLVSTKRDQNGLPNDVQLMKAVKNDKKMSEHNSLVTSTPLKGPKNMFMSNVNTSNKLITSIGVMKKNVNSSTQINTPSISQPHMPHFKHSVPSKMAKKMKALHQKNRRLNSRVQSLMVTVRDLQDVQIKYLKLKERVLDTEEKLLTKGIDTSEYSAFCGDNNPIIPLKKKKPNPQKIGSQKNVHIEKVTNPTSETEKNQISSTVVAVESQIQDNSVTITSLLANNKNVMSEHSYGVHSKLFTQKYF